MNSVLPNLLTSSARSLDAMMLHVVGLPYTLLTRDWLIHERARYLTEWAGRLPGPLRILDAGCGAGLSFLYLQSRYAPSVKYYAGLDFDTRRLRDRYRNASIPHDFIDLDLDSPWRLGKFDLIFASEVLEHIVEDRLLFARLCEHLTDQGVLLVTAPYTTFVQQTAKFLPGFDAVSPSQDGGHVRVGYEPGDLIALAAENSMSASSESYLGRISLAELCKRNTLRSGGDFANTARFNLRWCLHRALQTSFDEEPKDQCWSLAMAFQKSAELGGASA